MSQWFRQIPALWLLVGVGVFLATQTVMAAGARWVGWWQETAWAVHVGVILLLGIVATALGAWCAGSSRARGVVHQEVEGARSGPALVVHAISPVVWCSTLIVLGLWAAAYVRTAAASTGQPPWSFMVMTWALLFAQIAFGACLGVWLSRVIAMVLAPVVVVVAMASQFYIEGGEEGYGRLLPLVQQPGWDPDLVVSVSRTLLATGWLLAFSAFLVLLAGQRAPWTPPGPRPLIGLGGLAVAFAAAVVVPTAEAGRAFVDARDPADSHSCQTVGTGSVCVWAGQADLLPTFATAYAKLFAIAGGLDTMPRSLNERGLAGTPADAIVQSFRRHPAPDELVAEQLPDLARYQPMGCARWNEPVLEGQPWHHVLASILAHRAGLQPPDGMGVETVERALASLPRAVQDDWINRAQHATATCAPIPSLPTR